MKWYRDLYVSDSISHKKNRIKWKIIHNAGQLNVYVIALAQNEKNLLDLIPSWEFMQKYYPRKNKMIIGLAGNYDEALEMVECIIKEVYEATGNVDVRTFLKQKDRQKEEHTCISS